MIVRLPGGRSLAVDAKVRSRHISTPNPRRTTPAAALRSTGMRSRSRAT